eukprot:5453678-Amphidinium_carterae.1
MCADDPTAVVDLAICDSSKVQHDVALCLNSLLCTSTSFIVVVQGGHADARFDEARGMSSRAPPHLCAR